MATERIEAKTHLTVISYCRHCNSEIFAFDGDNIDGKIRVLCPSCGSSCYFRVDSKELVHPAVDSSSFVV